MNYINFLILGKNDEFIFKLNNLYIMTLKFKIKIEILLFTCFNK